MLIDTIALGLFIGYLSYWMVTRMNNTMTENKLLYEKKQNKLKYNSFKGFNYHYRD